MRSRFTGTSGRNHNNASNAFFAEPFVLFVSFVVPRRGNGAGLFFGLPRGRRGDWRFRCRAIACTQLSSPNGEPRLTLLRTALSSVAVSGLQHKIPVVGHKLVSQNPAGVTRQSHGEDPREGFVVLQFVENVRPGIASVQGVINSTRFVCTFWPFELGILSTRGQLPKKES